MPATLQSDSRDASERQWGEAVVDVEYARQDYLEHLRRVHRDEAELNRLWLRLWKAERRRDELFKTID